MSNTRVWIAISAAVIMAFLVCFLDLTLSSGKGSGARFPPSYHTLERGSPDATMAQAPASPRETIEIRVVIPTPPPAPPALTPAVVPTPPPTPTTPIVPAAVVPTSTSQQSKSQFLYSTFKVGQNIEAMWRPAGRPIGDDPTWFGNFHWYPVTVTNVNADGTYFLQGTDPNAGAGHLDPNAKPWAMRVPLVVSVGMSVDACVNQGREWNRATVTAMNGDGSIDVKYDDGGATERIHNSGNLAVPGTAVYGFIGAGGAEACACMKDGVWDAATQTCKKSKCGDGECSVKLRDCVDKVMMSSLKTVIPASLIVGSPEQTPLPYIPYVKPARAVQYVYKKVKGAPAKPKKPH